MGHNNPENMKVEIEAEKQELSNPLVSVIVPSYNHEKYITQCIESIINQTYKNYELIVVDDGSIDNSRSIISELQKKYKFIVKFHENRGLAKTLTETIRDICKGKYISICASDDFWVVDKLRIQVEFMESNVQYAMCFSKCYYVDEDSKLISTNHFYANEIKYKSGYIFNDLIELKYHLPVTYLFRKEVLGYLNYYPEKVYCEDYYMNLKIAKKYEIGYIDQYLIYYRYQINSAQKNLKIIKSQYDIILEYRNERIYKSAMREWSLRAFSSLSNYSEFKNKCLMFVLNPTLIADIRYWKSIVKLLIK